MSELSDLALLHMGGVEELEEEDPLLSLAKSRGTYSGSRQIPPVYTPPPSYISRSSVSRPAPRINTDELHEALRYSTEQATSQEALASQERAIIEGPSIPGVAQPGLEALRGTGPEVPITRRPVNVPLSMQEFGGRVQPAAQTPSQMVSQTVARESPFRNVLGLAEGVLAGSTELGAGAWGIANWSSAVLNQMMQGYFPFLDPEFFSKARKVIETAAAKLPTLEPGSPSARMTRDILMAVPTALNLFNRGVAKEARVAGLSEDTSKGLDDALNLVGFAEMGFVGRAGLKGYSRFRKSLRDKGVFDPETVRLAKEMARDPEYIRKNWKPSPEFPTYEAYRTHVVNRVRGVATPEAATSTIPSPVEPTTPTPSPIGVTATGAPIVASPINVEGVYLGVFQEAAPVPTPTPPRARATRTGRRASEVAPGLTPEQINEALDRLLEAEPDTTAQEVANRFGIPLPRAEELLRTAQERSGELPLEELRRRNAEAERVTLPSGIAVPVATPETERASRDINVQVREANRHRRNMAQTGPFDAQSQYELNAELRRRMGITEQEANELIGEMARRGWIRPSEGGQAGTPVETAPTPTTPPAATFPEEPRAVTTDDVESATRDPNYVDVLRALTRDPEASTAQIAGELSLSMRVVEPLRSAALAKVEGTVTPAPRETPIKKPPPGRKREGAVATEPAGPRAAKFHGINSITELENVLESGRFRGERTSPIDVDAPISIGYDGRQAEGVYIDSTGLDVTESAADINAQMESGNLTREQGMRKLAILSKKSRVGGVPISEAHLLDFDNVPNRALEVAQGRGLNVYVKRGQNFERVERPAEDLAAKLDDGDGATPSNATLEEMDAYLRERLQPPPEDVVNLMEWGLEQGIDVSDQLPPQLAEHFRRISNEGRKVLDSTEQAEFMEILADLNTVRGAMEDMNVTVGRVETIGREPTPEELRRLETELTTEPTRTYTLEERVALEEEMRAATEAYNANPTPENRERLSNAALAALEASEITPAPPSRGRLGGPLSGERGSIGRHGFTLPQRMAIQRLDATAKANNKPLIEYLRRIPGFSNSFATAVNAYLKTLKHIPPPDPVSPSDMRLERGTGTAPHRRKIRNQQAAETFLEEENMMWRAAQIEPASSKNRLGPVMFQEASHFRFPKYGLEPIDYAARAAERTHEFYRREMRREVNALRKVLTPQERRNIMAYNLNLTPEGRRINAKNGVTPPSALTDNEARASEVIHRMLDATFKQIQDGRVATGRLPLKYIQNYITHARWFTVAEEWGMRPSLLTHPRNTVMNNLRKHSTAGFPYTRRKGAAFKAEYDVLNVTQRYLEAAIRDIHMSPVAAKIQELITKRLRDPTGKESYSVKVKNPELWAYMDAYKRRILGIPNYSFSQTFGARAGRFMDKGVSHVARNTGLSAISFAVGSVINQFGSVPNIIAEIGVLDTMRGLGKVAIHPIRAWKEVAEKSKLFDSRTFDPLARQAGILFRDWRVKNPIEIANRYGTWFIQQADKFMVAIAWHGAYGKYLRGLGDSVKAANLADDVVARSQGNTMPSGMTEMQNSMPGGAVFTLQNFGINNFYQFLTTTMGIDKGKSAIRAGWDITKWILVSSVMGLIYKALGQESPGFSPITTTQSSMEEGDGIVGIAKDLALDFASAQIPVVGGAMRFQKGLGGPLVEIGRDFAREPFPATLRYGAGVPRSWIELYQTGDPYAAFFRSRRRTRQGSAERMQPAER